MRRLILDSAPPLSNRGDSLGIGVVLEMPPTPLSLLLHQLLHSICWCKYVMEVKWSENHSVMSDSLPMDYTAHGILQAGILEWVASPFSKGSSQLRDWTQISRLTGGFLPAEPPGKPKNIGVGSLSLLQRIFLSQESNRGLLHCRRILYELSYQGSPNISCIQGYVTSMHHLMFTLPA